MSKLAIDGGSKVFNGDEVLPPWPPVYPETAELLKSIYLSRSWSFYGEKELLFNRKFAEFTGCSQCVMMANGTVTLEMAMAALDIGPGDEVIVPAHTWLATVEAVVYRGAFPVVVDIEPDTLCMDPAAFEAAITPKTKAVIPVHVYGSMADMDAIMSIARKYGLYVIEDCAHAHGGFWDGKHLGSIGDIGSFSFQQSKLMASGEGGACITNDPELGEKLGRLSHIGYQKGAKQGQRGAPPPMGLICHNYRVTEFQAAILLGQLERLRADTEERAANAEYLRQRLNAIDGIRVQSKGKKADPQSYYLFTLMVDSARLKSGITRDKVIAALNAEGAPASYGWNAPVYRQYLWSIPENMYRVASCKNAEHILCNEMITCGVSLLHTNRDYLDKYCAAYEKVMAEYFAK